MSYHLAGDESHSPGCAGRQDQLRYYEDVEWSRALAEQQAQEMASLAEELAAAKNVALGSARLKSEFPGEHESRDPDPDERHRRV